MRGPNTVEIVEVEPYFIEVNLKGIGIHNEETGAYSWKQYPQYFKMSEQIEELKEEVKALSESLDFCNKEMLKTDKLKQSCLELVEGLRFYGERNNWKDNDYYRTTINEEDWRVCGPSNATGGRKARSILENQKELIKELEGKGETH